MQKWYHSQTAVFLTLLIVLLLTGWLRWFHFDSFPPGLWYDEAYHLATAQRIAQGVDAPLLYYPEKTGEPAFFWLTAVALRLGAGHLAPRWVAAVAGWVSVLLLFGAAHDILRPRLGHDAAWVAVGSAAILGSNYAFLFNSRMGWEPTLATAVIIAAVWLFWRALRDGHRRDFLGAGIVIGITPYTSVIARSLPLLLLLIGLLWLPQMRHQWRSRLVSGALLGGTAVFLLSPLLRLFITQPELFNRRLAAAAEPATWARNLGLTLAGFLWRSGKALHSLPDRPIFGPALALLLLIGSGVALWYWKRTSFLVWLLWLFSFIPAGVLSSPAPVFYRILPAVPAA
ncbi:MAG: glycosyltransferase family 39 protein, partial [Anaerolineales bacterium]|nr:glycosyltransferase family 39 protein [Anaerolineales bacterium]